MPSLVTLASARSLHSGRVALFATLLVVLLFAGVSRRVFGSDHAVAARVSAAITLGGQLAYISAGNVWVLQSGGAPVQITNDGAATRVRWSPGGSLLLVDERDQRLSLRPDGKPLPLGQGAWLPDDSALATTAGGGDLQLLAPDGSLLQTLVPSGARVLLQPVAWSPDGATLAFNRVVSDDRGIPTQQAVWLVGRAGGQALELLPPTDTWPEALGWSPDGRWLAVFRGPAMACVSCRADGQELAAVELATGRTLPLGTVVRSDGYCFSADGKALIASAGAGRESYRDKRLLRLDLASGATSVLAGGGETAAIQPACAPRGEAVAYTLGPALDGAPFSGLDATHGYPQSLLSGRRLRAGAATAAAPPQGYAQEAPHWAGTGALLFVQWQVGADAEPENASLWLEDTVGGEATPVAATLGTSTPPAPYFGDDGLADLFDWHP
ncbi:MAG TPA: hypothetical protein VKV26_15020 [Dehalococcoidia bacterium]|nr:hypothetical protein [Dehalococcoidia bacterium]